jgi:SAM-dependent methyltransferase
MRGSDSAASGAVSRGGENGVSGSIHPADEMFRFHLHTLRGSEAAARWMYFERGRQIADAFCAALQWRFGTGGAGSVLDFASGYGRSTRFLAARGAARELWVSDVDPAAVLFQEETFGVKGFPSASRPEDLSPGRGPFDAVLAASFFSHLPADGFREWLGRLLGLVRAGGLLAFSVHGPALHPEPADWTEGIVFSAESETRRLDPAAYGISWVTPQFVRRAVSEAGGAEALLVSVPFGLCGHQDLHLLATPPALPASAPDMPLFPGGDLDRSGIREGRILAISGWARAAEGEPPPEVILFAGDAELARSPGDPHGPARRRWSFEISIEAISPDEVLRVEARTRAGWASTVALGTLRPYL